MASITAHEIELYAVNTGELYETHKALARRKASLTEWKAHVMGAVVPMYRREIDRLASTTHGHANDAATALQDYYERHITEL